MMIQKQTIAFVFYLWVSFLSLGPISIFVLFSIFGSTIYLWVNYVSYGQTSIFGSITIELKISQYHYSET